MMLSNDNQAETQLTHEVHLLHDLVNALRHGFARQILVRDIQAKLHATICTREIR